MLTEVNFRLAGGGQPLILVPVNVNETGVYDFVLDTGAGTTLLTPALARKLSIEGGESREGQTAGGRVQVSIGSAASIAIGTARVSNLEVAIMDLSDLEKAVGAKIEGDIGYNYLEHFRVTLNYRTNRLRLARGRHETIGQAVLKEIPFRLAAPSKPLVLVRAALNGKGPFEFALDTGNSTTLVSPALADNLGIKSRPIQSITTGGGHKAQAAVGNIESLAVGGARVQNLQVVIADVLTTLSQATAIRLDGIIGYNFLKAFTVTIDYPNQTLNLEM